MKEYYQKYVQFICFKSEKAEKVLQELFNNVSNRGKLFTVGKSESMWR